MNWWVRSTKKYFSTLNYIEHFLISPSVVTGCSSVSAFAYLVGIPIEVTSSVLVLQELKSISQ